jgi:hypothetical protein|tara:strand:- start:123 stop:266 length:144 start_codon:yes stop_codon:yes gene_type:complete
VADPAAATAANLNTPNLSGLDTMGGVHHRSSKPGVDTNTNLCTSPRN